MKIPTFVFVLVLASLAWTPPVAAVCGDDVLDIPIEECDGLADANCPGLCLGAGSPGECTCAPAVCGDGVVSPAFEECDGLAVERCANGCTPDCVCEPLDHFQCYEAKPARFANHVVAIEDVHDASDSTVRFPRRLCLPSDKNDEGIVDATSHLTGYPTRGAFRRLRNQVIHDQFGALRLDLLRPDFLLVPTARDGVAIPPGNDLDHFRCYKVKRSAGEPKFVPLTPTVVNAYESSTVRLMRPLRLCVPANKNAEDPTAPTHRAMLLCYRTRSDPGFGTRGADIDNQFGPDTLELIHRRELCVPAEPEPEGE
jgi:hypothetical protein